MNSVPSMPRGEHGEHGGGRPTPPTHARYNFAWGTRNRGDVGASVDRCRATTSVTPVMTWRTLDSDSMAALRAPRTTRRSIRSAHGAGRRLEGYPRETEGASAAVTGLAMRRQPPSERGGAGEGAGQPRGPSFGRRRTGACPRGATPRRIPSGSWIEAGALCRGPGSGQNFTPPFTPRGRNEPDQRLRPGNGCDPYRKPWKQVETLGNRVPKLNVAGSIPVARSTSFLGGFGQP